jgi:hypothetical protein
MLLTACPDTFSGGDDSEGGTDSSGEGADEGTDTGGGNAPLFVAVGDELTVHTSENGEAWTDRTPNLPIPGRLEGAAFGNGTWIAVGGVDESYDTIVLRSADAESFELVENDMDTRKGVIFAEDSFLAFGYDAARSADGQAWQVGTGFSVSMNAIAHGDDLYVAVGEAEEDGSAVAAASSDGLAWTEFSVGGQGFLKVAHGSAGFVAVGLDGRIALSSDGEGWSDAPPTSAFNSGVGFDGTLYFLSSGAEHRLWTSSDGADWTDTGVNGHDHVAYSPTTELYVGVSGDGSRGYAPNLSGFISAGESATGYWSVASR